MITDSQDAGPVGHFTQLLVIVTSCKIEYTIKTGN